MCEQEGKDVGGIAAEFAIDRSSCCPKEIWACRLKQTNGVMWQAAVTQCKSLALIKTNQLLLFLCLEY